MEYESLADGRRGITELEYKQSDFDKELRIKPCLGPPRGPGQHCSQFKHDIGLHDLLWTGKKRSIFLFFARSK